MRQVKFLVAMALVVAVAAAATATAVRADDKDKSNKLVGKWTVTDVNKDSKKQDAKGKTVTITSDTITCYDKDRKTEMACKYTMDTSSKPNTITMTCTEGEHKGKKLMGIVDVEGDTAHICFSKPDEKAPTSTKETKEGQCCFTLKRAD